MKVIISVSITINWWLCKFNHNNWWFFIWSWRDDNQSYMTNPYHITAFFFSSKPRTNILIKSFPYSMIIHLVVCVHVPVYMHVLCILRYMPSVLLFFPSFLSSSSFFVEVLFSVCTTLLDRFWGEENFNKCDEHKMQFTSRLWKWHLNFLQDILWSK